MVFVNAPEKTTPETSVKRNSISPIILFEWVVLPEYSTLMVFFSKTGMRQPANPVKIIEKNQLFKVGESKLYFIKNCGIPQHR